MTRLLNISEAATAAGVSAKMVRHYEQIGLISAALRTESGYRQYSEQDVAVLRFIRQARLLGFSIEQIGELLSLWTNRERSSREVKALALGHLQTIEEKLREMTEMQAQLQRLVAACHGDDHPECAILDELAVRGGNAPAAKAAQRAAQRKKDCGRSGAGCHESGQRSEPASAPHLDLMAWTRQIAGNASA